MIIKTLSLGSMDNNCYIIADEDSRDAVVIDAPTNAQKIIDTLESNNLNCKYILLTHSHFDHIGALDALKAHTNAQVAIHSSETDKINSPSANYAFLAGASCPTAKADISLSDNDVITIGNIDISTIHTPGHTVGSMCFYANGHLFSGDTLFFTNVGRCDLDGGNYDTIKVSIKEKLYILSDDTIVYPGHGRSSSIAYEKTHNNYIRQDWEYVY